MKPLVLWCRWHDASLRLQGRDNEAVWGELAFPESEERFRFELSTAKLIVGEGASRREMMLDDMGVELKNP